MTQADLIRKALERLKAKLTITPFEFDEFLDKAKENISTASPADILRHKHNIRTATELIWNYKSVLAVCENVQKKPNNMSKGPKKKFEQQIQDFVRTAKAGLKTLEAQVKGVEDLVAEWVDGYADEEQKRELQKLEEKARAEEKELRAKSAKALREGKKNDEEEDG